VARGARADDLEAGSRVRGLPALKRVLVTGATGFIGRQTVEPLLARGYEVHAVGRREADLLDPEAAARLVDDVRPTHLLHLAWYAEPGAFWESPENDRWLAASVRLLEAFAAAGGSRAAVAGTCAEYDWSGDGLLSEAATPLAPRTRYGEAKNALREAAERVDVSLGWGRVFFLYGPHEDERRLVASVARALVSGAPARTTHGSQVRDLLHVTDVGSAFAALLDADVEGAVNIGSGDGVAIAEVVRHLADAAGRPDLVELGALDARPDDPPRLVADVGRLREEVGWRPARSLEEGLRDTVEWWRSTVAAS
jgi:nucleoside-diphosphate-sugar epimerase